MTDHKTQKEDTVRIIVINREWDEDLNYAKYFFDEEEDKLLWERNIDLETSFVPIVEKTEGGVEKDDPHRWVLPTETQIQTLEEEGMLWGRKDMAFFENVFEVIDQKFPDSKSIEISFLLHKHNGLDNEQKVKERIDSLISNNPKFEIQFEFFANAQGLIYEKGGFLTKAEGNFNYKEKDKPVGKFNRQTSRVIHLNMNNFKNVWEHYWYHTRNKLERYRNFMMTYIQYPTATTDNRNKAKNYTENLLFYLDPKNRGKKYPGPSLVDGFQSCKDLSDLLGENAWGEKNEGDRLEFVQALNKYVENQTPTEQLNQGLLNLIDHLYPDIK